MSQEGHLVMAGSLKLESMTSRMRSYYQGNANRNIRGKDG